MNEKFSQALSNVCLFLAAVMALLSHLYGVDGAVYEQQLTAIVGVIFLVFAFKFWRVRK